MLGHYFSKSSFFFTPKTRHFLLLTVNTVNSRLLRMKHPLEREREKKYVGLPEFARASEAILAEFDIEQNRGTVSLVPDERTIRYYLTEGLIQPPDERQGTASVFGYLQLLQLIAVKKLQAEHLSIKKIRQLVSGKDEQQLESLLGVTTSLNKKSNESEAKRYLESLLAPSMSLSSPARRSPLQEKSSPPKAAAPRNEDSMSWQRVEIEPGLELHIRSDYTPPESMAKTKGLVERIRSLLGRYWREPE